MNNRRKFKKGQSLVELAIVFPFFLLIILGGIIDFGFAFHNFLTLQQIVNDTAQWAAEVNKMQNSSQVVEHANSLKPSWWAGAFTVHSPVLSKLDGDGEIVSVTITYQSPTYTPFYQTVMQSTSGTSDIRLAAQAAYKIPTSVTVR